MARTAARTAGAAPARPPLGARIRAALALRSRAAAALEVLALSGTRPPSGQQLAVVLVGWDRARTAHCLELLERTSTGAEPRVVLVANRPEAVPERLPDGVLVVHGSNREAEFSGYDEGITALRRQGEVDVWLLANDRMVSYDHDVEDLLRPPVLDLAVAEAALVAWVDRLPAAEHVAGHDVLTYARSNYMLIAEAVLTRCGRVTTLDAEAFEGLVPGERVQPLARLAGDALPTGYLSFLDDWLTGSEGGRYGQWYRAAQEEQPWPVLRQKLHCIVNEHVLTARARAAGAVLLPPRCAAVLAELAPDDPSRRRQLELLRGDAERPWSVRHDRGSQLALAGRAVARAVRTRARAAVTGSAAPSR